MERESASGRNSPTGKAIGDGKTVLSQFQLYNSQVVVESVVLIA